jgi:hypothetical protein
MLIQRQESEAYFHKPKSWELHELHGSPSTVQVGKWKKVELEEEYKAGAKDDAGIVTHISAEFQVLVYPEHDKRNP